MVYTCAPTKTHEISLTKKRLSNIWYYLDLRLACYTALCSAP